MSTALACSVETALGHFSSLTDMARSVVTRELAPMPVLRIPGLSLGHNACRQRSTLAAPCRSRRDVVKAGHRTDWAAIRYFTDPDGFLWEVAHNPDFPC